MRSSTAGVERPQDLEAISTLGNARPLEDVAPLRMSEQTQRYTAEIARICGADAAPVGEEEG